MKRIKYILCTDVKIGSGDNPKIIKSFAEKNILWDEANEEIAKREAYNGEYTVEDDGQPDPEPTEQEQLRADVDFLLAMGGVL